MSAGEFSEFCVPELPTARLGWAETPRDIVALRRRVEQPGPEVGGEVPGSMAFQALGKG